jgi:hypothetical protein
MKILHSEIAKHRITIEKQCKEIEGLKKDEKIMG